MVRGVVLGLEVTVSLLDAIMAAVLVLAYEVALAALIIMVFRLLRRGDRHDRKQRALEMRMHDLELAVDSQQLLDRGPSIPRLSRVRHLPFGWGRRPVDPGRSDSYGDLDMPVAGASFEDRYGGDDSYPPIPEQPQERRERRFTYSSPPRSAGTQRATHPPSRSARPSRPSRPSRPTAPPASPESSDGRWEFPPDDSLGGAERARRANLPLTHWTQ